MAFTMGGYYSCGAGHRYYSVSQWGGACPHCARNSKMASCSNCGAGCRGKDGLCYKCRGTKYKEEPLILEWKSLVEQRELSPLTPPPIEAQGYYRDLPAYLFWIYVIAGIFYLVNWLGAK